MVLQCSDNLTLGKIAYCDIDSFNIQILIKRYCKMFSLTNCLLSRNCDTFAIVQQCPNVRLSLYQSQIDNVFPVIIPLPHLRVAIEMARPLPLDVLGDVPLLRELDPGLQLLQRHVAVAILGRKRKQIEIQTTSDNKTIA